MSSYIYHKGIIKAVNGGIVTVSITSDKNDCSGCAISRLCSKNETLDVPYPQADASYVGRKVTVRIGASQTLATVLMLVAPIILLILAMGIAIQHGLTEAVSALVAFAVVGVWYALVIITRRYWQKDDIIRITDIE